MTRFQLGRAGVLNVWQYDEQVFDLAEGRLLLRGVNGAGKSKTLEILLPFVIDGDKTRLTASARHHTSLLWLLLEDGAYEQQSRVGYVWVEFTRVTEEGVNETITCAVGMRASKSAKQATAWFFTCPTGVGDGFSLSDGAGPLTRESCREAVLAAGGDFFESARPYKEHVGRLLFGLDPHRYDELLKLLYWLRSPQIGEDLEPGRLANLLSLALPQLDDHAVRKAGDAFDHLAEFGEQLAHSERAADAVEEFCAVYRDYATNTLRLRGQRLVDVGHEHASRRRDLTRSARMVDDLEVEVRQSETAVQGAHSDQAQARARIRQLDASPEARSAEVLHEKQRRASDLTAMARTARRTADGTRTHADAARQRVDADGQEGRDDLDDLRTHGTALVKQFAELGVANAPAQPSLASDLEDASADVENLIDRLPGAADGIAQALAAVQVVADAVDKAAADKRNSDTADERCAEAEQELDHGRHRVEGAQAHATAAVTALSESLAAWQRDPRAVVVALPDALDATALEALPADMRTQSQPAVEESRNAEASARTDERQAVNTLVGLRSTYDKVAAVRDPAPAPPPWGRSTREEKYGAPLWMLVDFAQQVSDDERAGLEAGLESSGLLDAWVFPDGAVLDPTTADTALPVGPGVSGSSLADVLRPAGADSAVPAQVVDQVLRRVGLGTTNETEHAVVGLDGSWQLGPLTGRAGKDRPQYVGAAARTAERARRLAELDAQIVAAEAARVAAADARAAAGARLAELDAWLADLPSPRVVISAWAALDQRNEEFDRLEEIVRNREDAAQRARQQAADSHRHVHEQATLHRLPESRSGLESRRTTLRELRVRLDRQEANARRAIKTLHRWRRDDEAARTADGEAHEADDAAGRAESAAEEASVEHRSLLETFGAAVQELEARRDAAVVALNEADAADTAAQRRLRELSESIGSARQAVEAAQARLDDHAPEVSETVASLAAVHRVEGLVAACESSPDPQLVAEALSVADGFAPGDSPAKTLTDLATIYRGLQPSRQLDADAVYKAYLDLASGAAADTEPRVVPQDDLLAVLARDAGGEYPVVELAARLRASVVANRELLTSRERRYFEDHLLGELGEALRTSRNNARDLVEGMNVTLQGVRTSQGIRVRLDWRVRDDVSPAVRSSIDLLNKPLGMLLAGERDALRDALHSLIETSRQDAPELSYSEHLERALDYRAWSEFRVRIQRPETPDTWAVLGRRTPLSQGEQKVVCYLPLFAAASAHFHSVAGAAPHAPRFVLLDDAFPKIDARTHPELFGLLVELDLDFVITSERLWGDFAEVPALAIYEALRSPNERGIAQYKHLWDGKRLHSVGA